ncbi:hypothetical protein [Parasitella parasitica]|uniref:Endothelin-converting enzyme 1 n=1 Tax=Parasitella parasitica TaxID=35722 RepID=A0A0B7NMI3_9FUNG|nr:hypothetical protein [Parasitella parasitica]
MAASALSSSASNAKVCSTPQCAAIAKSILDDIDLNVDPCSDFYQYTCGGWLAKHTMPDSKVSIGTIETAWDVNRDIMRSILEGTYDDAYKSLISTDDGFHRQDQEAADQRNFGTMQNQTMIKLNQVAAFSLNAFYIYPDDKNPEINSISVIGEYSNGTNDATLRETESKKYAFRRWSNEKIAAAVDRFVEFEIKLASISLKAEEMQDPTKLYNPVKLSEFQAQNPLVDWSTILKSLVPNGNLPDTVINRAPPYFERLNKLLSSGSIKEQTLQEYFVIMFVMAKADSLDSTSREALRKMKSATTTGTTAERPRWQTCTNYVSKAFSNSIGRYYTLKKFGSEKEREKAEVFLTNIHKAWLDRVSDLQWLDEQTKAKAIEKINLIAHKVGYSTVSPDLRQPLSIEKYYEGVYINETSFYDTENNLSIWSNKKQWAKAGQKVDKDEWHMSPQSANAYYTPNGNEIVIPAGIMQSPLYDATYPDYLNYGGIGMIIGHEITHAFDSSGRKYDGRGLLNDWWASETSGKFEGKTQCFIDQYSKFTVSGPDNTTLNVNGKLTLAENLADNGGFAAALSAYKKLGKQEEVLPGLEHLSPEALFFINFGRTWCGKDREEISQDAIYTDPHSPYIARVNGVAQNRADFAEIFKCSAGSPMNPQTKCDMW